MTKEKAAPVTENWWVDDPAFQLVGFVPCVPWKGPDGDVEEGIVEVGTRRTQGVRLELLPDETLVVDQPDTGRRQVYPKGLASLIFRRSTKQQ